MPSCTRIVRILSPRIPLPTCWRRSCARAVWSAAARAAIIRARSTAKARARFRCWLRSSSHRTVRPVGRCVTTTADSVLLRCCPPAPDPRQVCHSSSDGGMRHSASVGSGSTATVIVLVWTRPRRSVGGIRCQRWPPPSFAKTWAALSPTTRRQIKPERCSRISASKPVPLCSGDVDPSLVTNEEPGVFAAFSGSNFDDHVWHTVELYHTPMGEVQFRTFPSIHFESSHFSIHIRLQRFQPNPPEVNRELSRISVLTHPASLAARQQAA